MHAMQRHGINDLDGRERTCRSEYADLGRYFFFLSLPLHSNLDETI